MWSDRGIILLEHAMKVLETVIEGGMRKIVKINNMQFGFMAEDQGECYFYSSSAAEGNRGKRPVDEFCWFRESVW